MPRAGDCLRLALDIPHRAPRQPGLKFLVAAKGDAERFVDDVLLGAVQELGVTFQQGGRLLRQLAGDHEPRRRFDLSRDEGHAESSRRRMSWVSRSRHWLLTKAWSSRK